MNPYRWIDVNPEPPENFESVEWEGCRMWFNKDGQKYPVNVPTEDAESIEGLRKNQFGKWQFKLRLGAR